MAIGYNLAIGEISGAIAGLQAAAGVLVEALENIM